MAAALAVDPNAAPQHAHSRARLWDEHTMTRTRATVADKVLKSKVLKSKVLKSEETAGHGNGLPSALATRQPKHPAPDLGSRAEGVSRAKRGNDGSPTGAKPGRGLMDSTIARPAMFLGRKRPDINAPVFGHIIGSLAP